MNTTDKARHDFLEKLIPEYAAWRDKAQENWKLGGDSLHNTGGAMVAMQVYQMNLDPSVIPDDNRDEYIQENVVGFSVARIASSLMLRMSGRKDLGEELADLEIERGTDTDMQLRYAFHVAALTGAIDDADSINWDIPHLADSFGEVIGADPDRVLERIKTLLPEGKEFYAVRGNL